MLNEKIINRIVETEEKYNKGLLNHYNNLDEFVTDLKELNTNDINDLIRYYTEILNSSETITDRDYIRETISILQKTVG